MVDVYHDQELEELSWMVVNGKMVKKLDLIAVITIYGEEYFTVYRRYNNVYEIVIKDYNNDIYIRKDESVYRSLQDILCLSDEQMENIVTLDAITFKYNLLLPPSMNHLEKMMWSDIQTQWYGVVMNVGGILNEYYNQKKRRNDNSDSDESEEDSDDEGKCTEMNEVEENSNLLTDVSTSQSSPTSLTSDTHNTETFSKLINLLTVPTVPTVSTKSCNKSKKKDNKHKSNKPNCKEEDVIHRGFSPVNEVIFPENKSNVYNNKRKYLEESNESLKKEELQSGSSLKHKNSMLFHNAKIRKLEC